MTLSNHVESVVQMGHILGKADFLKYLAKRRAQLKKDLADLETAEHVYKKAAKRIYEEQWELGGRHDR